MTTTTHRSSFRIGRTLGLLTLAAGIAPFAATTGCALEDDGLDGFDNPRIVEISDESTCVTLYAGQTTDVGTVCVEVDNTVDTSAQCGAGATGVLNVTYDTTGGWELVETHLAAGDAIGDIPANRKGNPKIGNFPYASPGGAGVTTQSYAVPLCEFGLDGADAVCDPVNAYFAAHASVQKDNGDGTYSQETAWGDGERLVSKGSWAEYFNLELQCKDATEPPEPPPVKACETAFALAGDGTETCFIGADFDGDGTDDGFSRWGWSNGPLAEGSNRQWPVYAAAGQCDLGNGTLVGHLTVGYDAGTAVVTFDRIGDFVLEEEHIYIGSEPLARDVNGEYTVAPGQFPAVIELDGAATSTNTITGLSGDVYVVYHAVACGDYDGGGDPGGGDGGAGDGGGEVDPLSALDDEFDGDLSKWDIHNPATSDVSVSGGALVMEPYANTWWYNGDEALHVNQEVTGDFMMSAHLLVTDLAGGPTAPGDPYRIGGIMLRDPAAPTVNSYHMGIGNMATADVVVVSKSTDESQSTIGYQALGINDVAEMRICRVGADIQGLIRAPGTTQWTIIDWHVRSDMPATVVAGPIAYAGTAIPDLRTTCDWVHYETVSTLQDCMKQ